MHLILKSLFLTFVLVILENKILPTEAIACPNTEDIYPCECSYSKRYLYVSCSGGRKDKSAAALQNILRNLSNTSALELILYEYNIGIVPSKLFEDVDVRKLVLSNVEIQSFEDDSPVLSGLENKLQTLRIYDCIKEPHIYNFTWKLAHLRKLHRFEFTGNRDKQHYEKQFWKLSNDWFENGPPSLKTVVLDSNGIESMGDKAFVDLVNLREWTASENNIKVIQRSMFPNPANKLVKLDFSRNKIKTLPEDFFSSMPSLEEVSFTDNQLQTLDRRVWEPVWEQLEELSLGEYLNCDSTINWIFNMKRPSKLHASCSEYDGDPDKRGKNLDDLIDKRT